MILSRYGDMLRPGMLPDIVQGLLNHSVDNNLAIPREKVIDLGEVTGDVDPIISGEVSDQPSKGGSQAEILQDVRTQFLRQAMDIFNDLIDV
jgi:hypothetical protein